MLRGVSRGTTLREPFGKSADTMLIRRLQGKKKKRLSHKEIMTLPTFFLLFEDVKRIHIPS